MGGRPQVSHKASKQSKTMVSVNHKLEGLNRRYHRRTAVIAIKIDAKIECYVDWIADQWTWLNRTDCLNLQQNSRQNCSCRLNADALNI